MTKELVQQAEALARSDIDLQRLDALHDMERLLSQVLALNQLLKLMMTAPELDERRKAAQALLKHTGDEDPKDIADRIRSSVFSDMDIQDLEELVEKGEVAGLIEDGE